MLIWLLGALITLLVILRGEEDYPFRWESGDWALTLLLSIVFPAYWFFQMLMSFDKLMNGINWKPANDFLMQPIKLRRTK